MICLFVCLFSSCFRPFVNEEEESPVRSIRIRLHSADTNHVVEPFETVDPIVVELGFVTCEEENENCLEEEHGPSAVVVIVRVVER